MKIVIAMDSFKGTIDAAQACQIVAKVIAEFSPTAQLSIIPMADGGEGTANTMLAAKAGQWVTKEVTGPLPDIRAKAGYAWFEPDRLAVVEMASASGLQLLDQGRRNPLKTTTYGTGQLIKAAAERNPEKILLGVGGSATVDCGVGAATALGWQFYDKNANQIGLGGGQLHRITKIIPPENLTLPAVEALSDVENRLCGPEGAARIFGPQKGANPKMVDQLEKGLSHLVEVVGRQLGKDIDVPKAGAAGGLAAGAVAFMNAKLVSGVDVIIQWTGLAEEIAASQWVITGEGRLDKQSLQGKVVSGIAKIARRAHVPVAVLAGDVTLTKQQYESIGITEAVAAKKNGMSPDYAMAHSRELLAAAAAEFAPKHLSGCH